MLRIAVVVVENEDDFAVVAVDAVVEVGQCVIAGAAALPVDVEGGDVDADFGVAVAVVAEDLGSHWCSEE